MVVEHRLKAIERAIVPSHKIKLWIIRDSYNSTKEDPEGKKRVGAKIEAIKQGKIKNRDGTFYHPGDTFFIIARIFTDKNPNKEPDEKESSKPEIEQRIKALKKRKADLEAKIKEKEK